ncbi:hypothetical protein OROMI_003875 [Orobanche minor]
MGSGGEAVAGIFRRRRRRQKPSHARHVAAAITLPYQNLHRKLHMPSYSMTSMDQSTMNQSEEIYLATSKFESNDDLLKSVRAFYVGKGYGLSIRDSKKDQYVTLQCDLSGVYQDKRSAGTKRKKSTGSRLTDCPFQIKGKKGSDGVWIFQEKNLAHNHDPSTDMSGHPSFRRLEPDDVQTVKNKSAF